MIRVLFICLGNICRSPMAEFVFRHLAEKEGLGAGITAASAGTSSEESGSPVHPGTVNRLKAAGISCGGKRAVQLKKSDYAAFDYLVCMESRNLHGALRIFGQDPEGKLSRLLDFTDRPGDISDPWYTGDFEATYRDVLAGCTGLLAHIRRSRR